MIGSSQLSDETATNRTSPTQVTSPAATGWGHVANKDQHVPDTTWPSPSWGQFHACAIKTDGQADDASHTNRTSPVQVTVPFATGRSLTALANSPSLIQPQ